MNTLADVEDFVCREIIECVYRNSDFIGRALNDKHFAELIAELKRVPDTYPLTLNPMWTTSSKFFNQGPRSAVLFKHLLEIRGDKIGLNPAMFTSEDIYEFFMEGMTQKFPRGPNMAVTYQTTLTDVLVTAKAADPRFFSNLSSLIESLPMRKVLEARERPLSDHNVGYVTDYLLLRLKRFFHFIISTPLVIVWVLLKLSVEIITGALITVMLKKSLEYLKVLQEPRVDH